MTVGLNAVDLMIVLPEQRLNRRQRCILSQLRSGHCYVMQDYKHRVLGEPSDICTDCGASPQDVRHMFACTTHPTDLSPEDLWRHPVGSIRAFSYLDNGNNILLPQILIPRIKKDAGLNVCVDCRMTPHDVKHVFACPAHSTIRPQ